LGKEPQVYAESILEACEVHSFEKTGGQPLEFPIVGVSRYNTRRVGIVDAPVTRRPPN
jgi:hypothetical protein